MMAPWLLERGRVVVLGIWVPVDQAHASTALPDGCPKFEVDALIAVRRNSLRKSASHQISRLVILRKKRMRPRCETQNIRWECVVICRSARTEQG